MKHFLFILSVLIILPCAVLAEQSIIDAKSIKHNEKLRSIKIEDGINLEEAEILSSEYFWKYVSGCGYAGKPIDNGEFWISIAHVGYTGRPLKEKIKIDKKTGTISMEGRPKVIDPLKEWTTSP